MRDYVRPPIAGWSSSRDDSMTRTPPDAVGAATAPVRGSRTMSTRVSSRRRSTCLRRSHRPIPPRKLWPTGAVPGLAGRIEPPNEPGMALCVYGDAGWGREVQRGKYVDGDFSDSLVDAAIEAFRKHWRMDPPARWVTALPSSAYPGLVDRYAQRLAARLGLPYVDVLTVRPDGRPQKDMQNSVQQLANAHAKLGIAPAGAPEGPVLLVDDIVDSGWTLTFAGWLLRSHGSGPVYPFALAAASARDG